MQYTIIHALLISGSYKLRIDVIGSLWHTNFECCLEIYQLCNSLSWNNISYMNMVCSPVECGKDDILSLSLLEINVICRNVNMRNPACCYGHTEHTSLRSLCTPPEQTCFFPASQDFTQPHCHCQGSGWCPPLNVL